MKDQAAKRISPAPRQRQAAEAQAAPTAATPPQTSTALEAARKSVEDAAAISGGLWLSYLFALFYIGIAAGGITHRDLLLENAVKLPFLNVELPLVAFFFLAPMLFVIVHAYTLVHFVLLAAKVGAYNQSLRAELGDADDRRNAERRRLPGNIFVQFLAGPHEIREGALGWLLKAIAWISLVVGPVLLLLLIQAQFLPFHLELVTWVQRLAVLADVVLLWALWPAVLAGRSRLEWPRLWRLPLLTLALVSFVPIGLSVTARFPNEWLDERIGNRQWIPANRMTALLGARDIHDKPIPTSFHDLLFNGGVDDVTQRRKSLFSNTLVLPGFDLLDALKIDDDKRLAWTKRTFSLRGRHLEGSIFNGADLRKADLTGAFLQRASFRGAQLEQALLTSARLQGASLYEAQLQGASLHEAQLQGASLNWAQLQGARLDGAQLQGASLNAAQLQGAWLDGAQLQGALLAGARLQGASLNNAQLQGALLRLAQLQGASLVGAKLQGANLGDFLPTYFAGTNMMAATLWRTTIEAASLRAVFMGGLKESPLSSDDFAALRSDIVNKVPDGAMREEALVRISVLDPTEKGSGTDVRELLAKGADLPTYQKALADELQTIACSGDESAAFIVHGFNWAHRMNIASDRLDGTGPFAAKLAASILAPDCPVSAELTESDRAALQKIAASAKPPTPTP